jgi:hypothetical protein
MPPGTETQTNAPASPAQVDDRHGPSVSVWAIRLDRLIAPTLIAETTPGS